MNASLAEGENRRFDDYQTALSIVETEVIVKFQGCATSRRNQHTVPMVGGGENTRTIAQAVARRSKASIRS